MLVLFVKQGSSSNAKFTILKVKRDVHNIYIFFNCCKEAWVVVIQKDNEGVITSNVYSILEESSTAFYFTRILEVMCPKGID